MAYESIVAGGGALTQVYGCTPWACANHSEWDCPSRGCGCRFGFHSGLDVAAPYGTPMRAVGYGRVIQLGRLGGTCGGLGPHAVAILTGTGADAVVIWYGHCSAALVSPGDLVVPGQWVARMGSLGCSTGTHLHYEVLPVGSSSGCDSRNPNDYLTRWPGAAPAPAPPPLPPPTPIPAPGRSAAPWALLAAAALVLYAAEPAA